jgi:signal transduction histidine kinase
MATSLRSRLRVGLMLLSVLLALGAIGAIVSLDRLGGAIAHILRENYTSVVACERMKESLERLDSAAIFAASGHDDVGRPMFAAHRPAFSKAFELEAANVTLPGEGDFVEQVGRDYAEYVRATDETLARPASERMDRYFRDLLPRFDALKASLGRIEQMNHDAMLAADREAKAQARHSVSTGAALATIAVFFAAWFAMWLPTALTRPLRELSATARAIGEGNLDAPVPAMPVSELAPLAEAFRKMLVKLRAYRDSSLGELLAAKDLANATVSCMLDPVIVFGREHDVILANEAAEWVFGIQPGTREELRSLEIAVPEPIAQACDTVLAHGEPVLPRTLGEAMRWDRGGEQYFLVRAAPLSGAEGLTGAVVLAQDVTRYRRIDALKSDVVATVSHQFKTPLTSLRMATHMLLEPSVGPLSEAQQSLAATAREETERLRTMVDELLDLVRIEAEAGALRRRTVQADALLSEVAEAHRTVANEKGVGLEHGCEGSIAFEADPERLSIVLANLVANAIRHTPMGGHISLSAKREGELVKLIVRDTGEGIAEPDLARIFERSVSLRSDEHGAGEPSRDRHGLGLTIAREIVLHHGGDITVDSAPGRGSTFTVSLPADAR